MLAFVQRARLFGARVLMPARVGARVCGRARVVSSRVGLPRARVARVCGARAFCGACVGHAAQFPLKIPV